MKSKTLFFSKDWEEVDKNKAYFAVTLTTDKDGKVLKSRTGIVKPKEPTEQIAGGIISSLFEV